MQDSFFISYQVLIKEVKIATILGAAVIDDVVVIIALAFLMSFAGGMSISQQLF